MLNDLPNQNSTQTQSIALWPFIDTGAYPTRSGNRVQPWIDGEPAFRRILAFPK